MSETPQKPAEHPGARVIRQQTERANRLLGRRIPDPPKQDEGKPA